MESARVKRGGWRPLAAGFAAATLIGVVLGALGPFGSYLNGTPPVRVAYWVVCLWAGWLTFGLALPLVERMAQRRGAPLWLWAPPTVVVLAVLPAAISRGLALRMWPVVGQVGWLEWYGQCLVISALVTAAVLWLSRPSGAPKGEAGPLSADPRERLPARLGRDVLCLQMEDHYVRVHTAHGSSLVLMSLSQAMAGLRDVEGVQTHRSWWVARAAIVGVIEDGRKLRLRLAGGLEAPVSRSRVGRLREDGWLAPDGG